MLILDFIWQELYGIPCKKAILEKNLFFY